MSEHADLEALSAYVDGEAPEWAGHVEGCAACRATVEQLRAVASAVGAPVEPPPAALRETALTAALGDLDRRHAAERARFARRRTQRSFNVAAIAAVILAGVLGLSALVALNTRPTDESTTLAGPGLESAPAPDAAADAKAATPPIDLGDVPDAATLVARARPSLAAATSANSGAASAAQAQTASPSAPASAGAAGGAASNVIAPSTTPGARQVAPTVVGTRPCEEQARSREPALREVVYFAVARRGQVPAVVLGFATGPAPSPVTLLLLARDGCAELLRAAGP
jgi:hypothetical protein